MDSKRTTRRRLTLLTAIAGLALAAFAPPAMSAVRVKFERLNGFKSPGTPAKYNKVGVIETGRAKAPNILVLNPGTSASAAYFEPLAKSIVAKAPDWQVWAVERRENLLEDQSMLDKAKAGKATGQQVFDYYLGYLANPNVKTHFQSIPDSSVAFAKQWGMNTEIQDLRRVVLLAQKRGKHVVVGGHSLGGSITTAYATWDFNGKAGAKGLSGLVFIDGGSGPTAVTADQARQSLTNLQNGTPWVAFGGIPAPFAGLFSATGALGALIDPKSPSLGQQFPLLPANLKPPVPVTNLGEYGYALDTATSPPTLAAAQAHLGHLAASGNPRGWDNAGELTPIKRFATMFAGFGLKGLDGTAWYHPMRLTIDSAAVAAGNKNDAQGVLDVHATHGADLPKKLRMYAFGAALGSTRVLDATRVLAKQSGIASRQLTLVDRHTTYAHNDPNSADPKRNVFLKKLIPFLRGIAKG
jgi:pimeloyl-ACP methyl ester carboxylesterase